MSAWGNRWGGRWGDRWGAVGGGGGDETAALGGVAVTEALGTLGKSTTMGVSGITVTVAAGTLGSSGGTVFTMPVGQYRHVTAAPSQPARPRRLKDLERIYQKWERKS